MMFAGLDSGISMNKHVFSIYTQTSYNLLCRMIELRTADGTTQTSAYFVQREGGFPYSITRSTDSRSNATYTWSDALGRTCKVVPPGGSVVTYAYDSADRLVSVLYGAYTTTLSYDIGGCNLGMSDPDMGSRGLAVSLLSPYDALGNVTQQTDARGCVTNLNYNGLNRLLGKTYSNATVGSCASFASSTPAVNFTYDQGTNGKGRRTGMAAPTLASDSIGITS